MFAVNYLSGKYPIVLVCNNEEQAQNVAYGCRCSRHKAVKVSPLTVEIAREAVKRPQLNLTLENWEALKALAV